MKVELIESDLPYGANTYKVSSGDSFLVIDPAAPFEPGPRAPEYILLTHAHFDHILYLKEWAATGAEVLISKEEADRLSDPDYNCYKLFLGREDGYFGKVRGLSDGEEIALGDEKLRFILTPGHTAGSGIYLGESVAFVGDTVFAGGGLGRWDLSLGDLSALKRSVRKIAELPEDILLYPGHGEPTTVKEYKKYMKI